MNDDSYYFAAGTVHPDLFGTPLPAPGVRVHFDPGAVAAFGNPRHWPSPLHAPSTRQGLAVYRDPTAVLSWPCRLWRVNHLADRSARRGGVELAAARTGEQLFGWIEEAAYWPILADPSWREASRAAVAMMTALSAPELLQDHEVQLLTARWQAAH